MFSVKHGLPCNILAPNSFIPQFEFVCIRVWVPYFSEHSIVSISYRETWKMERKSSVAIQRKSSNEKAQNVSENMDYIVLSGTKSRDCPTFNDLRSLNDIRLPKRTRSIYENREIISHKKNYSNSFHLATITSTNGASLFAPGGEKRRNKRHFFKSYINHLGCWENKKRSL